MKTVRTKVCVCVGGGGGGGGNDLSLSLSLSLTHTALLRSIKRELCCCRPKIRELQSSMLWPFPLGTGMAQHPHALCIHMPPRATPVPCHPISPHYATSSCNMPPQALMLLLDLLAHELPDTALPLGRAPLLPKTVAQTVQVIKQVGSGGCTVCTILTHSLRLLFPPLHPLNKHSHTI